MVNLVLVSHSPSLARGAAELARLMTQQSPLIIATAAGTGDEDSPLGTNAEEIAKAMEQAYSEDGVLVLMDMGSAVLSAEMALEFLPTDRRARFMLSSAPIVEGAVSAAVQASLGGTLEQVRAEAVGSLGNKAAQLSVPEETGATQEQPSLEVTEGATADALIEIRNRLGLHARPAATFVQTAGRFASSVQVARAGNEARRSNAKSINAVASMGLRQGEMIHIWASGHDASAAIDALKQAAANDFGESEETSAPLVPEVTARNSSATFEGGLLGIPASPGYAAGPAIVLKLVQPEIDHATASDPEAEWQRLSEALEVVRASTKRLHTQLSKSATTYEAAIFDAHLMFLGDPDLLEKVRLAILDGHRNAGWAWSEAIRDALVEFGKIEDDYMRARAADVADIGRQVLVQLSGGAATLDIAAPGILIAADLSPSDTARLDRALVLGVCTEKGGPTSHSAILARTLGIPAALGCGEALGKIAEGTPLIVDGSTGQVWTSPSPQVSAAYQEKIAEWRSRQAVALQSSRLPAVSKDGIAVEIVANIGSAADARAALDSGADGVGLLRSEFLFLNRTDMPQEDEQAAVYREIADVMEQRPLIIRTLDVGGDKPLAYLPQKEEQNPFLGKRALRLCLDQPDFFKAELRAILRASAGHNIKVMFPMVADIGELRRARALLKEAREELLVRGMQVAPNVDVGIMVEIPSAALLAPILADEVDFFSIGTNDLTQYTMAAERGNADVAYLQDALHPAVLQLVDRTVRGAGQAGKWVGVCGELAGDPLAMPILLGLGVKELSMAPGSIPAAKSLARTLDIAALRDLAAESLELESAAAVRVLVKKRLGLQ
ncbi:MAG: phosphoenolpyruvate--protein phosphotransferase [Caldiserica bacterium]|nr:phosphoenolpyruvate--protein phosphotransferase [Caldisericota bacterium]